MGLLLRDEGQFGGLRVAKSADLVFENLNFHTSTGVVKWRNFNLDEEGVIRFNMITVRPVKKYVKWIAMWSLLSRLRISCVPLRTVIGPYLKVWWQIWRGGGPLPIFLFVIPGHVACVFHAARPRWSWPVKQIRYKWTFPVYNTGSTMQWYNRYLNNSCWTYIDCLSL